MQVALSAGRTVFHCTIVCAPGVDSMWVRPLGIPPHGKFARLMRRVEFLGKGSIRYRAYGWRPGNTGARGSTLTAGVSLTATGGGATTCLSAAAYKTAARQRRSKVCNFMEPFCLNII